MWDEFDVLSSPTASRAVFSFCATQTMHKHNFFVTGEDVTCSHFKDFISSPENAQTYEDFYNNIVRPSTERACILKALFCLCSVCNEHSPRLHACFYCIFFGCYDTGHIQDHAKNEKHNLAIEVAYGRIFCFDCGDYTYSMTTLQIGDTIDRKWEANLGMNWQFRPWIASWTDMNYLAYNRKLRKYHENSSIGLRGLINLGNTCFMNCIVQALLHTPFLRNYFFSRSHSCTVKEHCIVCEVDTLFQEFYSGEISPLSLHRLLHIIWNQARHMAGYEQQDAHEFFIAVLDLVHRHSQQPQPGQQRPLHSYQCDCVIDRIFTGRLQSDIVCQSCKNISTTIDPFWDISLDIGTDPHSLIDCLERFTGAEHLDMIKCSKCNSYQAATKQLTLKSLPLVASFHLKRFEQSLTSTWQKISTQISFPVELDMSPFLTHARNGPREKPSQNNIYCLYAVTNHSGSMATGHYTAFIRQQRGQWFKCDDNLITRANLTDVLASEGYQLFYHKQRLDYE